jgi:hypothetical protein
MSDKPLFQDADEQEATYAGEKPAETPEGVIIPGAAAFSGGLSGSLGTAGSMGEIPAVGPAIAGATRKPEEDANDDGVIDLDEGAKPSR